MASTQSLLCTIACIAFAQASPLFAFNAPAPPALEVRQAPDFTPTGPFLGDFPDPTLLRVNDTWWAYSTSTAQPDVNIPIATSPDLLSWNRVLDGNGAEVDALPNPPSWANLTAMAGVWAPDVAEWIPGRFSLIFSAFTMMDSREHCLGVAFSSTPSGPFTTDATEPLICPLGQGGAIDASHFRDPETGDYYITYKVDGGSTTPHSDGSLCGNNGSETDVPTPLMLQRVSDPQSFALAGDPVVLLQNNGLADEGDIEAPSLLYVPPLDGSTVPSAVQKRDPVSLTTVEVDVTRTICPESLAASQTDKDKPSSYTPGQYSFTHPTHQPSAWTSFYPGPYPSDKPGHKSEDHTPPSYSLPTSYSPLPSSTDKIPPPASSSASSTLPTVVSTSLPAPTSSIMSSVPPPSSSSSSRSVPPPSSSSSSMSVPPPSSSLPSSTSSAPPPPSSPTASPRGTYILFFSPGCFADTSYAVSYAVSTSGVAGPYVRRPDLLRSGDGGLRSPGGLTAIGMDPADRTAAIVNGLGVASAVYHAGIPAPNGTRSLYTGRVTWDGTNVAIEGP